MIREAAAIGTMGIALVLGFLFAIASSATWFSSVEMPREDGYIVTPKRVLNSHSEEDVSSGTVLTPNQTVEEFWRLSAIGDVDSAMKLTAKLPKDFFAVDLGCRGESFERNKFAPAKDTAEARTEPSDIDGGWQTSSRSFAEAISKKRFVFVRVERERSTGKQAILRVFGRIGSTESSFFVLMAEIDSLWKIIIITDDYVSVNETFAIECDGSA